MSGIFFLLLAVALYCLYCQPEKPFAAYWDKQSIAFACAMVSPVVSIFLSQAYHGTFSAPPYDGASRFLFAIPIFLAFRHMDIKIVNLLEYAFPVAVLVVFLVILINPYDAGGALQGRLSSAPFVNVIHFGDLVLVLGALCLFSIHDLRLAQRLQYLRRARLYAAPHQNYEE